MKKSNIHSYDFSAKLRRPDEFVIRQLRVSAFLMLKKDNIIGLKILIFTTAELQIWWDREIFVTY